MIKKIVICGKGGQGIKFLSVALSNILLKSGYRVSLLFSYDGPIKGGEIYSNLIYSDKEIESPEIEEADLAVLFSEIMTKFNAKETIADSELNADCTKMPFKKSSAEKFGSEKFMNLVALGFLLKKLGLGKSFLSGDRREIIEYGYNLAG